MFSKKNSKFWSNMAYNSAIDTLDLRQKDQPYTRTRMAKLLICHSGQKGTFCSFINQTAFRSKQKNTGLLVFKNKFQLAFDKKETISFILLSLCKGSFAKKSSQKTSQLKSIQQTFFTQRQSFAPLQYKI